jgi:hypothetical protein
MKIFCKKSGFTKNIGLQHFKLSRKIPVPCPACPYWDECPISKHRNKKGECIDGLYNS